MKKKDARTRDTGTSTQISDSVKEGGVQVCGDCHDHWSPPEHRVILVDGLWTGRNHRLAVKEARFRERSIAHARQCTSTWDSSVDRGEDPGSVCSWSLPTGPARRCKSSWTFTVWITLPIRTVGEYLKRWGFTPQKPLKRAYERWIPFSVVWGKTYEPFSGTWEFCCGMSSSRSPLRGPTYW